MCSLYPEFVLTEVIFIETPSKGADMMRISVRLIRSVHLNLVLIYEILQQVTF